LIKLIKIALLLTGYIVETSNFTVVKKPFQTNITKYHLFLVT